MTLQSMTLRITPLVSDGCMIQRDRPVAVWGTAEPGRTVNVTMRAAVATGTADATGTAIATVATESSGSTEPAVVSSHVTAGADGRWETTLPARPAGTRAEITVSDGETTTVVRDVLFGDVWLLAGQSNMELRLERVAGEAPRLLDDVDDDLIRCFDVPQTFDFEREHDDLDAGEWFSSSRERIADMSAVGWFFAQRLRADVGVPVGLVCTAVGGSLIETWMSRGRLAAMGALPDDFDRLTPAYVARQQRLFTEAAARWDEQADAADPGLGERWQEPDFDDTDWDVMRLTESGRVELRAPGVIWLRKRISVPERFAGLPAQLRFGTMRDADRVYLDGRLIGETYYQYPPRDYDIDALPQEFTLAIRLKVENPGGGFTPGKRHLIVVGDALKRDLVEPAAVNAAIEATDRAGAGERADEGAAGKAGETGRSGGVIDVDAMGAWRFRRSVWMPVKPGDEFFRMEPVGDYNAMIVPLRRLALTGVLWYQGESNCWHPRGYAELQMALVQDWRRLFGRPDLPFIYAQLPNYRLDDPSSWLYLRDEQRRALAVRHTAMVMTYDVGDDSDLHPLNKRPVGERMAVAAESLVYGGDGEPMGPVPCSVRSEPNRLVVRFTHVGDGLRACGALRFEVVNGAGLPRVATFDGRIAACDRIVVDLPQGTAPGRDASLRFLWEPSPKPCLTNSDGLLASPFSMPID
ncbi:hypothetical protein JS533_005800 [Bifidobacterium amazonense]|uniref:Sialate O-acetylesterase domain-containing protein n=1 Tax=Bifidobacterium amazonense TaxID=2809027 RepID=A0ABS9VUL7_9BIFI|nr:sialate O-acetylesterase [Bifidobacterium amazonense]MCH9275784.1 hypothetical protein [Bifidobacterium amazonense]